MLIKQKKGNLGGLSNGILQFVVVAIVLVVGINLVSTLGSQFTASSSEANATTAVINAFATFTDYFTIIALVIVAAVVLWYVTRGLGGGQR